MSQTESIVRYNEIETISEGFDIPIDLTPSDVRRRILSEQKKSIHFQFDYELEVNGPSTNIFFNDSNFFGRQYFDAFGSLEFEQDSEITSGFEVTLIVENDGVLTEIPYEIDSGEIVPICACPYSNFSFMISRDEGTSGMNFIPEKVTMKLNAYIFTDDIRNRLISTPLRSETRGFTISDGYFYPL